MRFVRTLKGADVRGKAEPLSQTSVREKSPELLEAQQAHRESTDALLWVIEQGPGVRALVDRVQEHGRRNHWAEIFEQTMRRRHP